MMIETGNDLFVLKKQVEQLHIAIQKHNDVIRELVTGVNESIVGMNKDIEKLEKRIDEIEK